MSETALINQEPAALCKNCDSYIDDLNGVWRCHKTGNHMQPIDGCRKFFPDPKRWPFADHG